jgi:hypothetical protein
MLIVSCRSDDIPYEAIRLRRCLEADTFQAPKKEEERFTSEESVSGDINTPSPSQATLFPTLRSASPPENQPQPQPPSHLAPTHQQRESGTFKAPTPEKSPFASQESALQDTNTQPPFVLFSTHPPAPPQEDQPQPSTNSAPTQEHHEMPQQFTSAFQSSTHYEAYILRPTVHSTIDSSTLSYRAERLNLDDSSLESHVSTLGPDYSVLTAVAELLPDQLRIIQERANAREGNIVSVQWGKDVDFVTVMGSFRGRSVVFVIGSGRGKGKEKEKTCVPPASGTAATNVAGKSLFGNTVPVAKLPAVQLSSTGSSSNPFNVANTQPFATVFGTNTTSQALVTPSGSTAYYAEKDYHIYPAPSALEQYMSITFKDGYRDKSFEELRLADYKSGQTTISDKLTSLVGQSPPVAKPAFEGIKATQEKHPVGHYGITNYGITEKPAPFSFFGGGHHGASRPKDTFPNTTALANPSPALAPGPSGPSTTAIGFPAAAAPRSQFDFSLRPAPDDIAKNPFAKLALPVPSNPPSPRSEKSLVCDKSCRPHGNSKVCDECVKKMKTNFWLCEPKNIQKEAMRPVELGPDDKPENGDSKDKLDTALSALTIVPGSESKAHVETETKLAAESTVIAKEEDFNYDRETGLRETDAQKQSRDSNSFYALSERGVTWEKQTESPTSRPANLITGSTDFATGDMNNTSDTTPGDSNTVV